MFNAPGEPTSAYEYDREHLRYPLGEGVALAEAVLRRLCLGARVSGSGSRSAYRRFSKDPAGGEAVAPAHLNIGSSWQIYSSRPASFPDEESELPAWISDENELRILRTLHEAEVSAVEVGTTYPHLILTFTDGRVLFVNGKSAGYESWDLGRLHTQGNPRWWVIATPGDTVTVFAPSGWFNGLGVVCGGPRAARSAGYTWSWARQTTSSGLSVKKGPSKPRLAR